ncbi:MAG: hypothetical protein AAF223_03165 [Bacteroidota bacterium]
MARLFIFGIGGTGVRVIKSLTMLLASGVKMNATEVIPIIVDPHQSNQDLKRTLNLLEDYQAVRDKRDPGQEGFFQTNINTLQRLTGSQNIGSTFSFKLKNVQNEQFKDYINFGSLDEKNKSLVSLLFSEKNLATEMDIGFVGNPNIGSVVLNQFKDSGEFVNFASNFSQNDRIFIISSIFGGTGAAGFPTILKNIRNAQPPLPNHEWIRNAKVGAVTLLPYFGVAPDPASKIDKATFISKSKAALAYYETNVSGNNSVNALYYLGDDRTKDYPNDPGEHGQRNDAHFMEVAAAFSVVDFMNMPDAALGSENGRAVQPIYKEFGIKRDEELVSFTQLGDETQAQIKTPLTQYWYFYLYLRDKLSQTLGKQPWTNRKKPPINKAFTYGSFYQNHLSPFNEQFGTWLKELRQNKRAFAPFSLSEKTSSGLFDTVRGIEPQRHWSPFARDNYVLYDEELNRAERGVGSLPVEQKFMRIFYEATNALVNRKFDF